MPVYLGNYLFREKNFVSLFAPTTGGGGGPPYERSVSFYICNVIGSFCFSPPAWHKLRLCYTRPMAAKLTDNKTLFCHSDDRKNLIFSWYFTSIGNSQKDGTVWETVIVSVKLGTEWGVFERCLSRWWIYMDSEFPHSLIWRVKTITTSEKRTNDVAGNSWAGAWSKFRNFVPSSLVLSVGTESTMKERLEEEYKSNALRVRTIVENKSSHPLWFRSSFIGLGRPAQLVIIVNYPSFIIWLLAYFWDAQFC